MSTYLPGQWNAICDVCGFKFKSNEIRKRWDGLMVCQDDYEGDHPQKYIKVPGDKISTDWVRSQPEDVFIHHCTLWTRQSKADFGTADCMQADFITDVEFLADVFSPDTRAIADIAIASYAIADFT